MVQFLKLLDVTKIRHETVLFALVHYVLCEPGIRVIRS